MHFDKLSSGNKELNSGRFVELVGAWEYLGIFRGQALSVLLAEMGIHDMLLPPLGGSELAPDCVADQCDQYVLSWGFSAKTPPKFSDCCVSSFDNRNNVLTALPEEMEALKRLHTINLAFNR